MTAMYYGLVAGALTFAVACFVANWRDAQEEKRARRQFDLDREAWADLPGVEYSSWRGN